MSLLFILIVVSFVAAAAGVFFLLAPDKIRFRLEALPRCAASELERKEPSGLAGLLARLPAPSDPVADPALAVKCLHAGFRRGEYRWFGAGPRILLALLFAGAAFLALANSAKFISLMLYLLIAAGVGSALPTFLLNWKIKRRKQEIFEAFPDASDLLLICVEAGLGLDAALDKVSRETAALSLAMAEELHLCRLELRAGATFEQSLKNFAERTGVEGIAKFASMLTQADTLGVSIGDSLRVFADDLRQQRMAHAEELAARVPTKMLFPLIFFIFPATLLVLLGPAAIQIARTFRPVISGG